MWNIWFLMCLRMYLSKLNEFDVVSRLYKCNWKHFTKCIKRSPYILIQAGASLSVYIFSKSIPILLTWKIAKNRISKVNPVYKKIFASISRHFLSFFTHFLIIFPYAYMICSFFSFHFSKTKFHSELFVNNEYCQSKSHFFEEKKCLEWKCVKKFGMLSLKLLGLDAVRWYGYKVTKAGLISWIWKMIKCRKSSLEVLRSMPSGSINICVCVCCKCPTM